MKKILLLILILLNYCGYSQCSQMPSFPSCDGNILSNGVNINPSDKYYISSNGTYSNVNLNGGVLIICSGNVILNSFNVNGGKIYISSGAQLTTDRNTFGSGIYIYNSGILNFTNGIQLNNSSEFINDGIVNVIGNMKGNGTLYVNLGATFISETLGDWQNSGGICMGTESIIETTNITWSSLDNWIKADLGKSCISFSGTSQVQNNHTLTNSDLINICQKGVNLSGWGSWGSATLNQSCVSCQALLPIELTYFIVESNNIKWQTASEKNNEKFSIEYSEDGINWNDIYICSGMGTTSNITNYQYDNFNLSGYYRLKQTDYDGNFTYSKIIPYFYENENLTYTIISIDGKILYNNIDEKELNQKIKYFNTSLFLLQNNKNKKTTYILKN